MNIIKLKEKIELLGQLGDKITSSLDIETYRSVYEDAFLHNQWFTQENCRLALKNIAEKYLNRQKLKKWLSNYGISETVAPLKTGLVLAGNIPLVGFHDILCVFIAGHHAMIKMSSKDKILTEFLLKELTGIEPSLKNYFSAVDMLKGQQAVIATGSDNSARYFEYYFRNIPHIIRKNRTSSSVLTGNEKEEDLRKLAEDIFTYFGLGCRNVSKLFIPKGYPVNRVPDYFDQYKYLADHFKYSNNYFYQRSLLLMNRTPHLDNGFVLLKEDSGISSPIGVIYYEFYENLADLENKLKAAKDKLQTVVCTEEILPGFIKPGQAQSPELWDYSDGVDTLEFLLKLK